MGGELQVSAMLQVPGKAGPGMLWVRIWGDYATWWAADWKERMCEGLGVRLGEM